MNEQLRFITEDEYQELLCYKRIAISVIERIDRIAKSLYNVRYWCDTGNCLNVAEAQLDKMCREIIDLRRPFWKRKGIM